jgi:hypothetical protein
MRTETSKTGVLLNLPNDLLNQIDNVTGHLECSRSHFLRQSIKRNIDYFIRIEMPLLRQMKENRYKFSTPLEPIEIPRENTPVNDPLLEVFLNAY